MLVLQFVPFGLPSWNRRYESLIVACAVADAFYKSDVLANIFERWEGQTGARDARSIPDPLDIPSWNRRYECVIVSGVVEDAFYKFEMWANPFKRYERQTGASNAIPNDFRLDLPSWNRPYECVIVSCAVGDAL